MRTRFEGEKFLALPPGAEGPFGISLRVDSTRIFVPLHVGPRQHQGQVTVKSYEVGPFSMNWALVEIPKTTGDPQTRKDLAIGRERATAAVAIGQEITVVGGNPAIVVRDQFSTETPKQVIRSNSGEYELQIFESFYRVLDAKTGELLQERAGWDPNFSPTSRFLGAYSAGAGFEIIDLYSGRVITSNDILHRERGFRGNVHMTAWSPGDAIFALSVQGWGGIEVQQSLVDGSQRSFPSEKPAHERNRTISEGQLPCAFWDTLSSRHIRYGRHPQVYVFALASTTIGLNRKPNQCWTIPSFSPINSTPNDAQPALSCPRTSPLIRRTACPRRATAPITSKGPRAASP
jgi:hypothetical protein